MYLLLVAPRIVQVESNNTHDSTITIEWTIKVYIYALSGAVLSCMFLICHMNRCLGAYLQSPTPSSRSSMLFLVPLLTWPTLMRLCTHWMVFMWEICTRLRLFLVVHWAMDQLLPLPSVSPILATKNICILFQEHVNYHIYLRQSGHFNFKSSWNECLLLLFFPGIPPTIPSPFQSSTNIPAPGASGLVIGITGSIVFVVVLIMAVISSLIAYFFFCKRKESPLTTDSKVFMFVCVLLCMPSSQSACNFCFCGSLRWHVCLLCVCFYSMFVHVEP